nr:hypothetical protein [Tanacetum cinerariifolium]
MSTEIYDKPAPDEHQTI